MDVVEEVSGVCATIGLVAYIEKTDDNVNSTKPMISVSVFFKNITQYYIFHADLSFIADIRIKMIMKVITPWL